MEPLEQIKVRIEAAVPGAKIDIVPNSGPSQQHSLLIGNQYAIAVAGFLCEDPALSDVAVVLFDEFHERSLDADLGLALAYDVQQGLREDLNLLVMSATLDGARVAALLGDAPVIESSGRAFPVETRYLGRNPREPIERQVADAILRGLRA